MLTSEKMAASDTGRTYYRTLLLEMETGSNKSVDRVSKIKSYNHLIRTNDEVFGSDYPMRSISLSLSPTYSSIGRQCHSWV